MTKPIQSFDSNDNVNNNNNETIKPDTNKPNDSNNTGSNKNDSNKVETEVETELESEIKESDTPESDGNDVSTENNEIIIENLSDLDSLNQDKKATAANIAIAIIIGTISTGIIIGSSVYMFKFKKKS